MRSHLVVLLSMSILACGSSAENDILDPVDPESTGAQFVSVPANDLITDPRQNRYLASVTDLDTFSSSLVAIDSGTGDLSRALRIENVPRAMVVSPDRTAVWVALGTANGVQRIDLTVDPPAAGEVVRLPEELSVNARVTSMALAPGQPDVVVVVTDDGHLLALDADGPRPQQERSLPSQLSIATGPERVYGVNGSVLYEIEVDEQGVSLTRHDGLLDDADGATIDQDRLFAGDGTIIDLSSPDEPVQAGSLPVQGEVAVAPDGSLIAFERRSMPIEFVLNRLDGTTYETVEQLSFEVANSVEVDGRGEVVRDEVRGWRDISIVDDRHLAFVVVGGSFDGFPSQVVRLDLERLRDEQP